MTEHLIDARVHVNNHHEDRAIPTEDHCERLFQQMDRHGRREATR